MSKMDSDIAQWQREGPLFGSYDDPSQPGDRLCEETHNVYSSDRVVQVGPFHVHKNIYESKYYPPTPRDYAPEMQRLVLARCLFLILGLAMIGGGIAYLVPLLTR